MIEELASCIGCIHKEVCYMHETYGDCNEEVKETGCFAYQPQIPEGSVVLTEKEYEGLQMAKDFNYGYHEGERNMEAYYENIKLPEVCKETAEKILKEILFVKGIKGWQENKQLVEFGNRIVDKIEELAKQFGVEIKE